jgi:hypothetical protein
MLDFEVSQQPTLSKIQDILYYYSLYYFLVFLLVESLPIIFRISVQT